MINNFTGLTESEKKLDTEETKKFFKKAEEIVEESKKSHGKSFRDKIYNLIESITYYYQFHSTIYRNQLLLLQDYLSECIASLVNKNNDGFVKLEVYLKTKDDFVKKGWIS